MLSADVLAAASPQWVARGGRAARRRRLTVFADLDDVQRPLLGATGPVPGYVASLDEESRDRLLLALEERLSTAADGRLHLSTHAWAVRGRRP